MQVAHSNIKGARVKKIILPLLLVTLVTANSVFAQPVIEVEPEVQSSSTPTSQEQKLFFTSYGEIHYNNVDNTNDTLEIHRFTLGVGYDFSDKIRLRSEFEFEHGFTEPYMEFAYIDFEISRKATLRIGSLLLPIGTLNQFHEPVFFYSVERPEIYARIIPTSWAEVGLGFHGEILDGLTYQIYGHSSLNYNDGFTTASGFSGSNGLRGGRSKGSEMEANNFAGSARLQYTGVSGLRLGTSGFFGFTSQGDARVNRGMVSLIETDAKYEFEGIELEGLIAVVFNPEAGAMTTAQRTDGKIGATDVIGKRMLGYMFEAAYHVFHHAWQDAPVDLVAFARYEDYDTQDAVPGGFVKNAANHRQVVTGGLSFSPVNGVVIKGDFSWRDNDAGTAVNQFNLGLGYSF